MEKRKRISLPDILICAEFFLVALVVFFTIIGNDALVSLSFQVTFWALLLAILLQLPHMKLTLLHCGVILCIVLSFISVLTTSTVLSFNYFRKLIMFASTLLFFMYIDNMVVSKKIVDWILGVNLGVAALYIGAYFLLGNGAMRGFTGALQFNFSNPNLTGIYLLHTVLYGLIAFFWFKSVFARIAIGGAVISLLYFIWETNTRSCLIALVFFLVFMIIVNVFLPKFKFKPWASNLIMMIPMIVAVVYLWLCNTGFIEFFNFAAISEAKPLESREWIWNYAFGHFRQRPLIGSYGIIGGTSGMSQMHNTHVDVLVSYGVIPFVIFVIFICRFINKLWKKCDARFAKLGMFAFCAVIIMGSFEAALVSGGVGIYAFSGGFLMIAKSSHLFETNDN